MINSVTFTKAWELFDKVLNNPISNMSKLTNKNIPYILIVDGV